MIPIETGLPAVPALPPEWRNVSCAGVPSDRRKAVFRRRIPPARWRLQAGLDADLFKKAILTAGKEKTGTGWTETRVNASRPGGFVITPPCFWRPWDSGNTQIGSKRCEF